MDFLDELLGKGQGAQRDIHMTPSARTAQGEGARSYEAFFLGLAMEEVCCSFVEHIQSLLFDLPLVSNPLS